MKLKKSPNRVQALILSLLGMELGAAVEGLPPPDDGGQTVSHNSVLTLSAAWACVRLISETIATLPLSVYERTSSGKRVASQHPLHFVLHSQPNADCTASVFWEAVVAAMLLRGNSYIEKLKLGDRIVGLSFLHPDRMTVRIAPNGARTVQFKGENGQVRDIPKDRLWTIPGFSLDGKTGVSVIRHGALVFGAALAAQKASKSTFDRGLHQTTALKMPGTLREDQRDQAREALTKLSGAVNAGRSVILEANTEIETVGINPADAQMLETLGFGVEEVCRWFRVPPFMVGHTEKSTSWGSGIEQQMIGFLTFTLAPWLRRIEEAIKKDLLLSGDRYYAKFSVEGLLRADSAARAQFYSTMVNNGIFTRDDCREKEDMEPMGGNAAVLTVQSAMVPLDVIGQTDDSAQARAALMNWLREPEPKSEPAKAA